MSKNLKKIAHDILAIMGFRKPDEEPDIQKDEVQVGTVCTEEKATEVCASSDTGLDDELESAEARLDDESSQTDITLPES